MKFLLLLLIKIHFVLFLHHSVSVGVNLDYKCFLLGNTSEGMSAFAWVFVCSNARVVPTKVLSVAVIHCHTQSIQQVCLLVCRYHTAPTHPNISISEQLATSMIGSLKVGLYGSIKDILGNNRGLTQDLRLYGIFSAFCVSMCVC